MSRYILPFLAFAALAVTGPSEAAGTGNESMPCGDREEMLSHLSQKYSEKPVALGLATNGSIVEVLSSKAGDSFTIVYTTPAGLTCLMAAGSNWQFIEKQIEGIKT
ncbi:MAG: hypothetical protein OEN55_00815 [Alphaproteobacteria bacterium]|nr:hypothetical protein [Alphaproteobacteria bacterium]